LATIIECAQQAAPAKVIGFGVPPALVGRINEVIE
jgi:hypothetical protein